jgi:hypothetical protein
MPSISPEWPPELDAVIAAPDHHKILLENDQVRVLDTRIEPGETTPLHTHQWPATYYFISWSDFVRRGADGEIQFDSRTLAEGIAPGSAVWGNSLGPHTLEVVGDSTLHVVSIEIKP